MILSLPPLFFAHEQTKAILLFPGKPTKRKNTDEMLAYLSYKIWLPLKRGK
jgi:hypothetical protein